MEGELSPAALGGLALARSNTCCWDSLSESFFFRMTLADLRAFLDSSFNQTADVRLLQLFLRPSATTLMVLAVLAGLSLWVRHFWCRYLCPYGR
jgi:chromosome condensin MukBEF MukE localization factor